MTFDFEDLRKRIRNEQLSNDIVSTGSDVTDKVQIHDGVSKKERMNIAKDILCAIISNDGLCSIELMSNNIKYSYAIADMLIKDSGL